MFVLRHCNGFFISVYNVLHSTHKGFDMSIRVYIFVSTNMYIPGFLIVYIINIRDTKKHVQLILKIQNAFRIIKLRKYRHFIIFNWAYVLRYVGVILIFVILEERLTMAVFIFSLIYFDANIIYGISIINMIRGGVLTWLSEVEYLNTMPDFDSKEKVWPELFSAYRNFMDAFGIYKNVFQMSVRYIN